MIDRFKQTSYRIVQSRQKTRRDRLEGNPLNLIFKTLFYKKQNAVFEKCHILLQLKISFNFFLSLQNGILVNI
jgi:hypothetical protein